MATSRAAKKPGPLALEGMLDEAHLAFDFEEQCPLHRVQPASNMGHQARLPRAFEDSFGVLRRSGLDSPGDSLEVEENRAAARRWWEATLEDRCGSTGHGAVALENFVENGGCRLDRHHVT
ncbi:MAG: hypothetical protein KC731_36825 [Myxococcales bacterium]|nr:hypothetical protein [Myxococcales bacterium]